MRQIRFRAWSNEHHRYCDFVTLDEIGRWIGWIKVCGVFLNTIDIVLEQDTGLKDKNGETIWEGDIVKSYNGSDAVKNNNYTITEVKRDNFYTGFYPMNRDENAEFNRALCEVIGNIHENPELLEEDEKTTKI